MWEKVFEFAVEHLTDIGGLEWLIIVLGSTLATTAAWLFFRSIYRERYAALADLVELRKTAAEEFRSKAMSLESDRASLFQALVSSEERLEQLSGEAFQLRHHRENLQQTLEQLAGYISVLQLAVAYLELLRITSLLFDNLRGSVAIFMGLQAEERVSGAPSSLDLFGQCEEVAGELKSFPDIFPHVLPDGLSTLFQKGILPATVLTFPVRKLTDRINELSAQVQSWNDQAIAKHE